MTWKHALVICFAIGAMVACGYSANCGPMIDKLSTLCLATISGVMGNALAEHTASKVRPEPTPGKNTTIG